MTEQILPAVMAVAVTLGAASLPALVSVKYRREMMRHLRANGAWIATSAVVVIATFSTMKTDGWPQSLLAQVVLFVVGTMYVSGVVLLGLRWLHQHHPDAWGELGRRGVMPLSPETRRTVIPWAIALAFAAAMPVGLAYVVFG